MAASHELGFVYLSQEALIDAGAFDMRMAMDVAEAAMLAFEEERILFPDKIVQIFDEATQSRINCLPATLLDDSVCGVKWVSVFPENPRHGLQNLSAILVLSEIEHGFPVAVMEGTLASNMRVGAVGGVAARYLSREDSEVVGIIGAGEQAKMHLLSVMVARPGIRQCRVSSRSLEREQEFVEQMRPILPDVEIVAVGSDPRAAVDGADILITATSAQAPLLKADWMKPGAFYSHVGGWEDEYAVAQQCDKIVCDSWETVTHRTQTLSRMHKEGLLSGEDIHADLHELVSGAKPGRERDDERAYFCAVGLAYIDVALAHAMYLRARADGAGLPLELQHEMVFEHANVAQRVRL
jgi:ornithine cyclodeaminase/alanine dehydrogenase-like protein (mu-crystallin family)